MKTLCVASTYGGKDVKLPAYLDSKYNKMILNFAQKYDGRSTQFLNTYMCSEMCPCYNEKMIEENVVGIRMAEYTPKSKYFALSE